MHTMHEGVDIAVIRARVQLNVVSKEKSDKSCDTEDAMDEGKNAEKQ